MMIKEVELLSPPTIEAIQVLDDRERISEAIKFARDITQVEDADIMLIQKNNGIVVWDSNYNRAILAKYGDYIVKYRDSITSRPRIYAIPQEYYCEVFKEK